MAEGWQSSRPVRGMRKAAEATGSLLARRHKPDYQIVLYMGLLMLIGLIIMYAIGPQRANTLNSSYNTDYYGSTYFFVKQSISLLLALSVFVVMAFVKVGWLQKYAGRILIAGFIACALLFICGNLLHLDQIVECTLGACRWFSLGPLGSIQPAEFLKFGLLIFFAGFLGTRMKQGLINDIHQTLIPLGIAGGAALILVVLFEKDMGTGIVLAGIMACMLMVAGVSKKFGIGILALGLIAGIIFIVMAPHRMERIVTFFQGDSSSSTSADDYHIRHAKIAIGTGGLFGVGIGNSVQATGYLPEAINDSVFAIMGETFGFVGLVAILALFAGLLLRLLRVLDNLIDNRLKLIVAGVFGWLATHVVLNVASMTGVFPLTGITLPLLSFGGTSMVFMAGALGLVFQLSRYTSHRQHVKETDYEDSGSRRRIGRTRYTGRSSSTRTQDAR